MSAQPLMAPSRDEAARSPWPSPEGSSLSAASTAAARPTPMNAAMKAPR